MGFHLAREPSIDGTMEFIGKSLNTSASEVSLLGLFVHLYVRNHKEL